ncbi:MAG TPA: hypothetical protein VF250_02550 [Conexibacter sp.]
MAETATAAKPKKRAPARRKPAAKTAKTPTSASKTSTRSTSTRRATRAARAQQLAERAALIPVGAAREARDRVAGSVEGLERHARTARRGFERQTTQVRKQLDLNLESLTTRVEKVVQNGVDAGMKLVNGAQERLSKVV